MSKAIKFRLRFIRKDGSTHQAGGASYSETGFGFGRDADETGPGFWASFAPNQGASGPILNVTADPELPVFVNGQLTAEVAKLRAERDALLAALEQLTVLCKSGGVEETLRELPDMYRAAYVEGGIDECWQLARHVAENEIFKCRRSIALCEGRGDG